jgi:hypothetical protein
MNWALKQQKYGIIQQQFIVREPAPYK